MAELDNKKALALLNKEILKQEQEIGRTMNATTAEGKKQNKIARDNLTTAKSQQKELIKYLNGYKNINIELQSSADLSRELSKTYKANSDYSDLLLENSKLIVKYGLKSDFHSKKLAKALGMAADNAATIQSNMDAVGTAEFQQLNLSKQIFEMEKKNLTGPTKGKLQGQILLLKNQESLQEQLQKAHDITEETAKQFMKPAQYMQELVGKIPIVGGALSKMIPIDKWEDDIKNKVGERVKEAFNLKSIKTEATPELGPLTKGGELDMRYKTNKEAVKGNKIQESHSKEAGKTAKGLGKGKIAMIGIAAVGAVVVGALMKMAMASFKFANDTGLSYKQTLKLGGALAVNAEGVAAIAEEFGNINGITTMMAVDMKILNKQYGISATASAKILKLQTATSGMSNRQLLSQQKQVAQMARLEGVSPAAVFESMAANSEDFAKFTKDSGKNLMKMAIQAKKVGLEMSTITGAMESSLNLESSINAQFEASVLLGRQLNMDKFRQLSLAGDALGAQKELVRLVGSEQEWNSMNLIQRKALADAVGMQVSEVGKVVGAQNKLSDAQEKGHKMNWASMGIMAAIGAVLTGVIIAAISALSLGGLTGKASGAAIKGGLAGMAVGAGIGAGGSALYQSINAKSPDVSGATMNPGTVANVRRGEMAIHAGETAVNTQDFNMAPMIEELKALRKDMRVGSTERAEQSRQQINTIRGIGAANA
jgi:hypothetical protein